jgi:hypothetical protein
MQRRIDKRNSQQGVMEFTGEHVLHSMWALPQRLEGIPGGRLNLLNKEIMRGAIA